MQYSKNLPDTSSPPMEYSSDKQRRIWCWGSCRWRRGRSSWWTRWPTTTSPSTSSTRTSSTPSAGCHERGRPSRLSPTPTSPSVLVLGPASGSSWRSWRWRWRWWRCSGASTCTCPPPTCRWTSTASSTSPSLSPPPSPPGPTSDPNNHKIIKTISSFWTSQCKNALIFCVKN